MSERLGLRDDVSLLKGIGSKKKEQLSSAGIYTIEDLLEYFPVKYKDRRSILKAIDAPEDKDSLTAGVLTKIGFRPLAGGRTMIECTLRDDSCLFHAVFFNMPYLRKSLSVGERYVIFGRMRLRNGSRVWTNPEMTREGSDRDRRGIIPIYKHSSGLTDVNLRKWISEALMSADMEEEWIDSNIVRERKLSNRKFALYNMHYPASEKHYKAAKYRINYDTMLIYQLAVRLKRKDNDSGKADASVPEVSFDDFLNTLSFELTSDQKKCIDEISTDLTSRKAMNRLVQGDVGCGKTIVAEAAIYRCAKAGMQSAMMAPTEILALQHFEKISSDLKFLGIKCVLLTSGMRGSERRSVLKGISDGSYDVIIGTHALIQNEVEFYNLALVITDEQHRFGVDQRRSLTEKGRATNVLVMSATPIPRTLANTVFGDMDFSIIRTMPGGRKKIITRALDKSGRERAYSAVRDEIEKGHLAYVIAPSIDSEDDELLSVNKLFDEIRSKFPKYKAALLHGRMKSEEKDSVMEEFASGEVRILVSTIVIEVGIDVPDASIIVIENSERFGLAQLHQLRGRVGRSDIQSYCYVINYGKSETAIARADAMARISDGFEISELDYEMRGPGDITGTVQSGNLHKDILALSANTELLEAAISDAERIMTTENSTNLEYVFERYARRSDEDRSEVI